MQLTNWANPAVVVDVLVVVVADVAVFCVFLLLFCSKLYVLALVLAVDQKYATIEIALNKNYSTLSSTV